ncbi:MAG: acyltransferase family protein [Cyclobacteriaceae bacterium]|nr:acyltransferase family protein [Cyclobacteriaceae bacterium]
MNDYQKPGVRFHALDALRATMMLLGLVLHSAESYNMGEDDIWPRDPHATDIMLNYLNTLIHVFRMPIFFLVAGFFAAMLFYQRGPGAMIDNRFKRIVIPFVLFLLILHPFILLAIRFTTSAFNTSLSSFSTELTILPGQTYHLWFLYYLALVTGFSFLLASAIRKLKFNKASVDRAFQRLFGKQALAILILSLFLFIIMLYRWDYGVPTPLSFTPKVGAFAHFLLFYLVGWMLYRSRQLIPGMKRWGVAYLILGLIAFTVTFRYDAVIGDVAVGVLRAVVTWLFVIGFIGTFVSYADNYSQRSRYLSDASYWMYLIHLPLTLFVPGLMAGFALPAVVKFLITLMVTFAICLVSYHFLVRSTFVGQFLNGRKYISKNQLGTSEL